MLITTFIEECKNLSVNVPFDDIITVYEEKQSNVEDYKLAKMYINPTTTLYKQDIFVCLYFNKHP